MDSSDNVEAVNNIITETLSNLPGPVTVEKLNRLDQTVYSDWDALAEEEFASILKELIRLFGRIWPLQMAHNTQFIDPRVVLIFSIDHSATFIAISMNEMLSSRNSVKFDQLVPIFESCIRSDYWLPAAIIDLSFNSNPGTQNLMLEQKVTQLLLSAPSRIANQMQRNMPQQFRDEPYCSRLMLAILRSIVFMANVNHQQNEERFATDFLARLISRIVVDFCKTDTAKVFSKVFEIFGKWSAEAPYSTFTKQIISQMSRPAIEACVSYILNQYEPELILGNSVTSSDDWKFVLQTKLPLTVFTTETRPIRNLVRYLSQHLPEAQRIKILEDVAKDWSGKSSIRFQSIEQQLYDTKFILLGLKWFEVTSHTVSEIKSILHRGVKNHLESLSTTVRLIGMITVEIALNYLNRDGELRFEYDTFSKDEQNIVAELRALMEWTDEQPAPEATVDGSVEELQEIASSINSCIEERRLDAPRIETTEIIETAAKCTTLAQPVQVDQIDSDDDDLQAYDAPNDTSEAHDKRPRYLSNLIETIRNTDDPDLYSQALICCTDLVKEKLADDIGDIGNRILALLISLQERFYVENHEEHRFAGCVAVVVVKPKESAEYLCKEFNSEATVYSISTRIFILDVLCEAAKQLSSFQTETSKEIEESKISRSSGKLLFAEDTENKLIEARQVIRDRLEMKTRRFAHASTKMQRSERINRFAPVAGDFLFPLIRVVSQRLLKYDSEHVVKHKLINAIANIILAAKNSPMLTKIAAEIFDLSMAIRFHPETEIRLAVMQMIAATLVATPPSICQAYFAPQIKELIMWLQDGLSMNVLKREKSAECRELAHNVLAIAANVLQAN